MKCFEGSFVSSPFDSEEFGWGHKELDILCMTYTMARACCLAARSIALKGLQRALISIDTLALCASARNPREAALLRLALQPGVIRCMKADRKECS